MSIPHFQIRDLTDSGRKLIVLSAGEDIPISYLLWHPSVTQLALFIASANGVINCTTLYDDFGKLVRLACATTWAFYSFLAESFQRCRSCKRANFVLGSQRLSH
jgi:hypothetical protein